jgi:hypothetical protein
MWRRILLAFAGAQLLFVPGCNDDWEDRCAVGECICRDLDACDVRCGARGCRVDCARASRCGGECVDDCSFSCHDTSSCAVSCGENCAVDCSRASACNVDCRNGCRVTCNDVSSCNVRLAEGWVVCERAGLCNVHCVPPGGAPTPAHDCGGGRFACGPC